MRETSTQFGENTFGGRIYSHDYEVAMSMSDIAERIERDMRFDHQCHMACNNRDKRAGLLVEEM